VSRIRDHHARLARRHGRLFWRVYLYGVVLLVVVALTLGAVGIFSRTGAPWGDGSQITGWAAERVVELASSPGRLSDELRRVREVHGIHATVYGPDGAVIATNVEPPLAVTHSAPHAGRARLQGGALGWAAPLPGGRGRLVVSGAVPPHDPGHGALVVAAVLVALALASYPLARSIASPIERLTGAARALGGGDLAVRANVRARGEVGQLGRAFDEMAARLERLVLAERELLANVSHELRTPLARIRVALELAAEGDLDRARRFLAEIATDLDELDRLIADVLAAARLDASALPLARAPLDVAAVVREAAERFRSAHPARALDVRLAEALPVAEGDASLLRRLLAILLDNAAKYSEPPTPVRLAARAEGGALVFEVRDEGIGIDAADLPRLFTPFFRTDRSRARGTGGTGLGLALARRIAEAHGGTIAAESAPGRETIFRATIPAAKDAPGR
jgi:signal transduction histidine kinase